VLKKAFASGAAPRQPAPPQEVHLRCRLSATIRRSTLPLPTSTPGSAYVCRTHGC